MQPCEALFFVKWWCVTCIHFCLGSWNILIHFRVFILCACVCEMLRVAKVSTSHWSNMQYSTDHINITGNVQAPYSLRLSHSCYHFHSSIALPHSSSPGACSATSIILRGADDFMVDEMECSIHNALCVLKRVLESNLVVTGGGAVKTALSIYLEDYATSIVSVGLSWVKGLDMTETI